MKLFALADPHLSFNSAGEEYKPMGIFGDSWLNHGEKIRTNWLDVVQDDDVVLLPGTGLRGSGSSAKRCAAGNGSHCGKIKQHRLSILREQTKEHITN